VAHVSLSGNHVTPDAHCGVMNRCCFAVCKGCRRRAAPLKPVASVSSHQVCSSRTACCSMGSQSVSHRNCCYADSCQQADHSRHTTTTCRGCAVVQISWLVQVCCSYTPAQGSTHCAAVSSYCSTDGPNHHVTAMNPSQNKYLCISQLPMQVQQTVSTDIEAVESELVQS